MDVNSIDELFGSKNFIRDLKYQQANKSNNHLLNELNENKLYLTVTNTKTNQSELYILNLKKSNEHHSTTKQLEVDKYKKSA